MKRENKINHAFNNAIRSIRLHIEFSEILEGQLKKNKIEINSDEKLNLLNKFTKRLLKNE